MIRTHIDGIPVVNLHTIYWAYTEMAKEVFVEARKFMDENASTVGHRDISPEAELETHKRLEKFERFTERTETPLSWSRAAHVGRAVATMMVLTDTKPDPHGPFQAYVDGLALPDVIQAIAMYRGEKPTIEPMIDGWFKVTCSCGGEAGDKRDPYRSDPKRLSELRGQT